MKKSKAEKLNFCSDCLVNLLMVARETARMTKKDVLIKECYKCPKCDKEKVIMRRYRARGKTITYWND